MNSNKSNNQEATGTVYGNPTRSVLIKDWKRILCM